MMIEDAVYHLAEKTGMKYNDLVKLPAKELLDMMSKLIKF